MTKQKLKRYGHSEGEEQIECTHCKKKYLYFIKWYYEDRPRMKDGKIVIPLEMIKTKCYESAIPSMCKKCKLLPRCEDCTVIMCGWKRHDIYSYQSVENPNICKYCQMIRNGTYPHIGGVAKKCEV